MTFSDLPLHERRRFIMAWRMPKRRLDAAIRTAERALADCPPDHPQRRNTEMFLECLLISRRYRDGFGNGSGTCLERAIIGGSIALERAVLNGDAWVERILDSPPHLDEMLENARLALVEADRGVRQEVPPDQISSRRWKRAPRGSTR